MKIFTKSIPLCILVTWLTAWLIAGAFLYTNLAKKSQDGFVLKRDCLRLEKNACVLYSRLYKVNLKDEFALNFVSCGIVFGAVSQGVGFGYILWKQKKHRK